MYTITAYDKNHNRLLLDPNTAVNTDGDIHTEWSGRIVFICASRKTANVPDPETGQMTSRTRKIAYFRVIGSFGYCQEIYFTAYGRQAGVRNYQTRRPGDRPTTNIIGAAPIHTEPRIERHDTYGHWMLVVGEGNPYGNDLSGDFGEIIAQAIRQTRTETGWSGYQIWETYGKVRDLPGATVSTVHLAFKEALIHYQAR